jgi:hypothetical protein
MQPAGGGCGYLYLGFEAGDGPADCMERITVDMVLAAAMNLLELPPPESERVPGTPVDTLKV